MRKLALDPGFGLSTSPMYTPEAIEKLVVEKFPDARARVRDLTGTQDHYELIVVSSAFAGKGLVERHRMVYAAIGTAVGNEIHALSLKTFAPDEPGAVS